MTDPLAGLVDRDLSRPLCLEDAIGQALDAMARTEPYCDRYDLEAAACRALGAWESDNDTELPEDEADGMVQAAVSAALEARVDELDRRATEAAHRRAGVPGGW